MSRAIYEVIIIGGSYAGLAAALQLVRARRKVLILDAGQRRNRFAGHSHGFLGQDGQPPGVIATKGKAEVLAYPTVTWKDALATEAMRGPDGFVVRAGGDEFRGKRLILATGVVDELPSIPGLSERWGKRVFFCPYCDGYEFGLGSLGVLATSPQSAHFAVIVSEWAAPGQTTFFLNGQSDPDVHELAQLRSRGITVEREPVVSVCGDERSIDLHLRDGRTTKRDGLFLLPRTRIKEPFAEELGCELETGALGSYYKTDAIKETTVQGVFACGDVATPMPGIAYAVADGVRAGGAAHQSLVFRAGVMEPALRTTTQGKRTVITAQDESEVNDCISMGGTANLFTITEKSGIGVLTGTIDGAAYGEPTSDLKDLGNGDFEFTMMHYFLDKDGSRLHTHDKAVMHPDPKGEGSTLEVEYTVVQASGRFAGYGGTFRSRGWVKAIDGESAPGQHSVGVVHFEGVIRRR